MIIEYMRSPLIVIIIAVFFCGFAQANEAVVSVKVILTSSEQPWTTLTYDLHDHAVTVRKKDHWEDDYQAATIAIDKQQSGDIGEEALLVDFSESNPAFRSNQFYYPWMELEYSDGKVKRFILERSETGEFQEAIWPLWLSLKVNAILLDKVDAGD